MNAISTNLLRLAALPVCAGLLSSCVHLKPANREFHTAAEFAYDATSDSGREEITAEEALQRIPKDPTFQKIKLDRPLDRSYLQAPMGPYRVGPGDELESQQVTTAGGVDDTPRQNTDGPGINRDVLGR
jgi:hypothetical protein